MYDFIGDFQNEVINYSVGIIVSVIKRRCTYPHDCSISGKNQKQIDCVNKLIEKNAALC